MLKDYRFANVLAFNRLKPIQGQFKKKQDQLPSALFTPIDNSQLILFRIVFGLLITLHCLQSVNSDWVRRNFMLPSYTFAHIGMEWLQPLPGEGMLYYFYAMGVVGLLISVGLFYRFSMALFTIMWAGVYFMQKTAYNNHHYLLLLLGIMLFFLPANCANSVDGKLKPSIRKTHIPQWCIWVLILQVGIVYFYATVAKLYPDWLDGTFTREMLSKHATPTLKTLYSQKWFYLFIAYAGILFDLLVVPLMLWRRTRMLAFIASVIFHFFNKIHLGIGIFPFLALSFSILLFPPETIRRLFFRKKTVPKADVQQTDYGKRILLYFFVPYFIFQLAFPLRHWLIEGDVLWTEEGHRLSWRMMLRNRSGYSKFYVVDHATSEKKRFKLKRILTKKQIRGMQTKPDMIWQTAQKIKEVYEKEGKNISIYIDSKVSINKKPLRTLIDPNVDFAKAKWNYFTHNEWILLYK